jgi:hypothetical protein
MREHEVQTAYSRSPGFCPVVKSWQAETVRESSCAHVSARRPFGRGGQPIDSIGTEPSLARQHRAHERHGTPGSMETRCATRP